MFPTNIKHIYLEISKTISNKDDTAVVKVGGMKVEVFTSQSSLIRTTYDLNRQIIAKFNFNPPLPNPLEYRLHCPFFCNIDDVTRNKIPNGRITNFSNHF